VTVIVKFVDPAGRESVSGVPRAPLASPRTARNPKSALPLLSHQATQSRPDGV